MSSCAAVGRHVFRFGVGSALQWGRDCGCVSAVFPLLACKGRGRWALQGLLVLPGCNAEGSTMCQEEGVSPVLCSHTSAAPSV